MYILVYHYFIGQLHLCYYICHPQIKLKWSKGIYKMQLIMYHSSGFGAVGILGIFSTLRIYSLS